MTNIPRPPRRSGISGADVSNARSRGRYEGKAAGADEEREKIATELESDAAQFTQEAEQHVAGTTVRQILEAKADALRDAAQRIRSSAEVRQQPGTADGE